MHIGNQFCPHLFFYPEYPATLSNIKEYSAWIGYKILYPKIIINIIFVLSSCIL